MAINLVTGWNEPEHKMFGGDLQLGQDDRYVRAEEFIQLLRGRWTGSPFSFDGRIFKVEDADLQLRPATPEPPEIFTASRSERGLDMVASQADWWFLDYDKDAADTEAVMESLRHSIAEMNERAGRLGRKLRFAFNPFIAFGNSDQDAMEEATRLLTPDGANFDQRKVLSRIAPAMKGGCIGRPEKVREQLRRYHDLGIELFLFKMAPSVQGVLAVKEHIIDHMRAPAV